MVEIIVNKRIKPRFLRVGWHKMIKLGSTVKKKRKWRRGIGRHNKIRLGRAGRARRPKVGWGTDLKVKGLVNGLIPFRVENIGDLKNVQKGYGALIASVGKKKKKEIISEANKMKITILNRYKEKKNAIS